MQRPHSFVDQPLRQHKNGIAVCLPEMFFLLGAVSIAIDVADVMSAVAIGIAIAETLGRRRCARD